MSLLPESLALPESVAAFAQASRMDANRIRLGVHENDQMYAYSLAGCDGDRAKALIEYYRTGMGIFDSVKQIVEWHFGSFDRIGSFLDFASGYGRFMRFLLGGIPADRIWCSDIYPAAVRFQQDYFGVDGLISVTDPADFSDDRKFDCILSVSFFTHAPRATFNAWLSRLIGLLSPYGLLIFSVHDLNSLPPELRPEGVSLHFRPGSYDPELPAAEFGGTYVEETYLRRVLHEMGITDSSILRIKSGFDFFQDVYVIRKQPGARTEPLRFVYLPFGNLHTCTPTANGDVLLEGCATDHFNDAGRIETVELSSNGRVVQRCVPNQDWPEIVEYFHDAKALHSKWTMQVPRSAVGPDDIVTLMTRNSRNREYLFFCGTLDPKPGAP